MNIHPATAQHASSRDKNGVSVVVDRAHTIISAFALVVAMVLATSGPAAAKLAHEPVGTFPTSEFSWLSVDNSAAPSSGNLYVGEISLETFESRVYQTDASGTATGVELNGSETPDGFFGFLNFATFALGAGPAVVGSSGANSGSIYLPDTANGVVDLFDETGQYVCQITGRVAPSASECAGAGNATPRGGLSPTGVAVDPSNGQVAVANVFYDAFGSVEEAVVYEFNEAGEYLGEIADASITLPGPLAYDSAGSLYVVNASLFGGGDAVKLSPAGSFEYVVASNRLSVAVDLSNDHVYVGGETGAIAEFDSSGAQVISFGEGGARSIGVNKATRFVYISLPSGGGRIWTGSHFFPTVETEAVSDVLETTATLSGHVDPELAEGGSPVEVCSFEYGLTETYGQIAPCSPGTPYSNPTEVTAGLSGLSPGTRYHYRVVAENAEVKAAGEDLSFQTPGPPSISGESAIARPRSAIVSAQIDPFGYETVCEVEYVDDAFFSASGFGEAAVAPCEESLAAGFGPKTATVTLQGLMIETTYHFRFVATNQGGTTTGEAFTVSTFSIESFAVEALDSEGQPFSQAGGHPYALKVSLALSTTEPVSDRYDRSIPANLRSVKVQLPPGLLGVPTATPTCQPYEVTFVQCPPDAQLGRAVVFSTRDTSEFGPIYNVAPPEGVAAQLGARFNSFGTVRINAGVRTGGDYGIESSTVFISALEAVEKVEITLWGVPADGSHDAQRQCRYSTLTGCKSGGPLTPFLTMPTACRGALTSTVSVDTWQDPGTFASEVTESPEMTGCEGLDFKPRISVQPDVRISESPAGLEVNLHVPQDRSHLGLATAHLKDAVVRLPDGVAVNPAVANGLAACGAAQIELNGSNPANCPAAAKIGTAQVKTPLLDHRLLGSVYVAAPTHNPFSSLLAIYIAVHDPKSGVVVKLAGHVKADPQTGQLTTTFRDNPQLPFEDFTVDFFGGPGAALVTPETCGTYTTTTDLRPWSENGDAHPYDSFAIDAGPSGSPCAGTVADKPNQLGFTAGTINPVGGDDTPLVLGLSREDGSQRLALVDTELPPGLVGKLAGVPYCPEVAIGAAAAKQGAAEQASPSCPAASRVGTVNVGAGAGPRPYFVQGTAYLAGPYKGAPLSLAVVTPAVAGPYDLGTVVVRVALHVDPETAQITAKSDPLPQILAGIPLNVRVINLRTDITRNPTNCEPMSVGGTAFSVVDQPAPLYERFQVGGCAELGFEPRLHMRLFGKTNRGAHPKLRAVLKMPQGGANIARAAVTLPPSELLDQSHIRTVCTRVQFAAQACPTGSIYGYAVANTPLLDEPLRGPVYLRSSSNKLPDLVADLHGQIDIELVGRIDSVRGGIRTVFQSVPDAPVSSFMLVMKGGSKGLLQNSTDICKGRHRALARFGGHNGAVSNSRPMLKASCGKRERSRSRHRSKP